VRRRIVVTGGHGFVGRALVGRFADLGHDVTSVDLADTPYRGGVRFVKADLRDGAAVATACAGADTVIHNASLVHTRQTHADDVWAVNLGGTENVIAACQAHAIPRLVYLSSASAVYEGRDIENGDETLPYSSIPQAPYADSKIAAEKLVLAFSGAADTLACAIRPHVVFGPGDNRLVPAIVRNAQAGKLKRAVGHRDKLSDFTYVDNLVDAVVAAADRLAPGAALGGQAYFVTNGEPMAFFDFVDRLLVALGFPPTRGSVPYPLAYTAAAVAETIEQLKGGAPGAENTLSRFAVKYLVTHHYFRIDKARRDLAWQPRVTIADGIRRTAQALQARPPG
jgi:nucleoside-diphosphate-sugar epimerase